MSGGPVPVGAALPLEPPGATRTARIGVSACIMHADPQRPLFKGKTLLYAEESMLGWIMAGGALPFLLPRASGPIGVRELLGQVDGVILQGGVDMSPRHYGEEPVRQEWSGDPARDVYEMELVRTCLELDLPVLGVCRGAQVLNVALGGSLYQDIETMHDGRRVHRNWDIYDRHGHDVVIEPGSWLGHWYGAAAGAGVGVGAAGGGSLKARINSVHHQGLKTLGRDVVVEARSDPDGVVEAIRYEGRVHGHRPFAYGVQWHPEFLTTTPIEGQLEPETLLRGFLAEIRARQHPRPEGSAPP
jgi:putative glutamine amidotransferase